MIDINSKTLHSDILSFRKRKGVTLRFASEKTGLSVATLYRIEKGTDSSLSNFKKAIEFYNSLCDCSPYFLVGCEMKFMDCAGECDGKICRGI